MKKRIFTVLSLLLLLPLVVGCEPKESEETEETVETSETENDPCLYTTAKPVIYLYPEDELEVEVKLDFSGRLTCTYPEYADGWKVTAYPDGRIVDKASGKEYSYLFWEGANDVEYDLSRGFVVAGEDTAAFLQDTLAEIGLTPKEYNEFIVYWLPHMQENAYNLITFQTDVYTDNAELTVSPEPDSLLRVFMAFKPLEAPVEIEAPTFEPFVRNGFTVVEWGGTEIG